jgi:integrase
MTKPKARRQRGSGSLFRWKNRGPWWMKFYRNGVPILESCKTTDRRAAEKLLAQRLAEIATDSYTPTQVRKTITDEVIDDLLVEYRNNNRRSVGHLEMRWRRHLKPYFGGMTAAQVTSDSVARYVNRRKQEGAANASINRELAILKRALNLAKQCGKIKAVPHIAMLAENNTRTGFLSSKDRDALANACARAGLWMRSLLEVALTYGWRHAELLDLKVKQVNLVVGSIRLEPGTTKNLEGREVPMTPPVRELLTQCVHGQQPDAFLFHRDDGNPVRDFRTTWCNCCVAAGVGTFRCPQCSQQVDEARRCAACKRTWRRNDLRYDGLIFHSLRRSAARNLRNSGVPEGVVQKIGGWRTRSMFDRYSIIDQSDISDALVKLERRRETEAAEAEKQAVWVENGKNLAADENSGVDAPASALRRN